MFGRNNLPSYFTGSQVLKGFVCTDVDYKILDMEPSVMWLETCQGPGKRVSVSIVCVYVYVF